MKFTHYALLLIVLAGCNKQSGDDPSAKNGIEGQNAPEGDSGQLGTTLDGTTLSIDQFSRKLARLTQTAVEHEQKGGFEQAIAVRKEMLHLVEAQYGPDSWQAANARLSIENVEHKSQLTPRQREQLAKVSRLDKQARELVVAGNTSAANDCYSKVLEIAPEIWHGRSYPMARFAFLKSQVCVANYQAQEAEKLLRYSLPILEKKLSRVHPEYAAALNSLGMLLLNTGRLDEARPLLLEATQLTESVWGLRSRSMATQLNNLGTLWHASQQYTDAEHVLLKALDIQRETAGPDHASVAHTSFNLGALYNSTGDFQKAVEHLERSAKIYEQVADSDTWTTIRTLSSLATAYYSLKDFARAEALLRRVVDFGQSEFGPTGEVTAASTFRLAMALCFQAKYEEAEPLLLRTLEVQQETFGSSSPELLPAMQAYAELLDRTGRKTSSAHVKSQIRAIQTQTAARQPAKR